MSLAAELATDELILEWLEVGTKHELDAHLLASSNLSVEQYLDPIRQAMILEFTTFLMSREVRVEKQWTDQVEEPRWARWLRWITPPFLRRVTVKHYHNCPHIDIPRQGESDLHMGWLHGEGQ